jgi:hypothetical protein
VEVEDALADWLVARLDGDSRRFLAAMREPDGERRAGNIAALYGSSDPSRWRDIDEAVRIERDERVRLAALRGLARRLHEAAPPTPSVEDRLAESWRDWYVWRGFDRTNWRAQSRERDLTRPDEDEVATA